MCRMNEPVQNMGRFVFLTKVVVYFLVKLWYTKPNPSGAWPDETWFVLCQRQTNIKIS